MKLKYISEDDLNSIKSNITKVYDEIINKRTSTLDELLGVEKVIKDTVYDVSDFKLSISFGKGKESYTDFENVQRVYNNLKFLSDSQASDERIWVAYTLCEGLDYMLYRWPADNYTDVINRYLFGYTVQRSLFRNGMSRLWWIGRITYDENREDPYELTKFVCRDQDFIESICGRNIFNNPSICKATVQALMDAEKSGFKITRDMVRNVARYVNLLGGVYLLDMLEEKEIYDKIKKKIGF